MNDEAVTGSHPYVNQGLTKAKKRRSEDPRLLASPARYLGWNDDMHDK
jgi:hypothetical protein